MGKRSTKKLDFSTAWHPRPGIHSFSTSGRLVDPMLQDKILLKVMDNSLFHHAKTYPKNHFLIYSTFQS
jgi:hypothetical protein